MQITRGGRRGRRGRRGMRWQLPPSNVGSLVQERELFMASHYMRIQPTTLEHVILDLGII